MSWYKVATKADLVNNSGICVLLAGRQIALFALTINQQLQLFAIDNYDPIGQANVLSRGITGSLGERLVVASPLYKQHFDLQNGQCLEMPELTLTVYPVKWQQQEIWLQLSEPHPVAMPSSTLATEEVL